MNSRNPFASIRTKRIKRNKFNLSHDKKLSMKMGFLYPILHQDVIPGDSFKVNTEILMRVAPMLAPIMHRINVYTHFFFVPNRLVWNEWEDFITGGEDGEQEPVFPTIRVNTTTANYLQKGSLADYFGVPTTENFADGSGIDISALPFRAYQLIYNEYYRDQNLIQKVDVPLGSGSDGSAAGVEPLVAMQERAWEKDYFTSALPWTQRGGEAEVPIEWQYADQATYVPFGAGLPSVAGDLRGNIGGFINFPSEAGEVTGAIQNLSEGAGVLINDLRKASRVQEWLEKSARGGSRYIEQIKSFFGVISSDARLQRPEYLGGGKQPIRISEVLNTVGSDSQNPNDFTPQGNMTGHGISVGNKNKFSRSFEEHGQIIGIINVRPKTAYQQGLPKKFRKFDKFDYYFPQFAHLGEQPVTRSEIYQNWDAPDAVDITFGYQQRYAEYKYEPNTVHGDFRDTLDFWHLSRQFDANPFLNQTFITCRPRLDFLAVQDGTDYLWVQIFNHVSALRPMPYFSIPTL